MVQGPGGPPNDPMKWDLSRQVIQIAEAEASFSGVCARTQPQPSQSLEALFLPWLSRHLRWLPTVNNEWLTASSSGLGEFAFSFMFTTAMGGDCSPAANSHSGCQGLSSKFRQSWLLWPGSAYAALPCRLSHALEDREKPRCWKLEPRSCSSEKGLLGPRAGHSALLHGSFSVKGRGSLPSPSFPSLPIFSFLSTSPFLPPSLLWVEM